MSVLRIRSTLALRLMTAFALVGLLLGVAIPLAEATGRPEGGLTGVVSVSPGRLVTSVGVGAYFGLHINVYAGGNQVNATDVHLAFDPDYLRMTSAPTIGALPAVAGSKYDNVAGTLDFGAYKPDGYATGTFKLCTLHFQALQATSGAGTLITSRGLPLVVAPLGVPHSASWSDGKVIISAPPTPTKTQIPSKTLTPTLTPKPSNTPIPSLTPKPSNTPVPSLTPRPSNTPVPSLTPLPSDTPVATSTVPPVPGQLCVSVYNDLDQDGVRDAGEPLLAGSWITVTEPSDDFVADYVTDGASEPYCFDLPPGLYVLSVIPPPGYQAAGPTHAYVNVVSDYSWNLDLDMDREGFSVFLPLILRDLGVAASSPSMSRGASLPERGAKKR